MRKNLFMIMCHKNLDQVFMLMNSLYSAQSDIVIHIDSSVPNDEYFSFLDRVKNIKNIYITEERIHGVLDTRSLVDIVFVMLRCVKEKKLTYQYYCLLSGQDLPIKPISMINDLLNNSYPKPYIDCTPYDKNNWIYHKFKDTPLIRSYNDFISEHFSSKNPIRKGLRATAFLAAKIARLLKLNFYHSFCRKGISLYGGSAWWILPDIAIDDIYDKYVASDKIVSLLLKSYTPEETFFQIMTKMSPVKDLVEINPKEQVLQNCKTWAYFFDEDKPFMGHPYIFSTNDFDKLKESNFWFARKFDITTEPKIIQLVIDNLCKESNKQ